MRVFTFCHHVHTDCVTHTTPTQWVEKGRPFPLGKERERKVRFSSPSNAGIYNTWKFNCRVYTLFNGVHLYLYLSATVVRNMVFYMWEMPVRYKDMNTVRFWIICLLCWNIPFHRRGCQLDIRFSCSQNLVLINRFMSMILFTGICDHSYWHHIEIVCDHHPETSLWLIWYRREKREIDFLFRGDVTADW